MKKSLILSLTIVLSTVATSQVFVKIKNLTDKDIQLKITYGEASAPYESYTEIYSQSVKSNSSFPEYVKLKDVKKKKKIYVTGSIPGLGNFKFDERVIAEKKQKIDIDLRLSVNSIPSDNQAYQELMNQLNYTPPKGTQKILSADVAYKSFFGGLSIRKDSVEIDRIEPSVLKAEVSPIQYGSMNRNFEVYFSGNFISENKGEAPGIAGVALNVSKDELYKLKYNLADIGIQIWSPPAGKSINTLFQEMNESDKTALIKRYLRDTTITLFQYDHMYLFKSLTLNMDKYKRTSTTLEANVPVFFSSGNAYKKEEGENFTTNAFGTVLNIWATKDVTNLLVQAAQEYLEKQRKLVQTSTSNKDAQNIILASQIDENGNFLNLNNKMTKGEIDKELEKKIGVLKGIMTSNNK